MGWCLVPAQIKWMNFVSAEQLTHQRATPDQPLAMSHWIDRFLDTQDINQAARYWVEFAGIKDREEFVHSILSTIEQIDAQLNQQLDEILHCKTLQ
nr:type VI secretion system contractile sheath large subunit [Vibrio vulnificus]